MILQKLLKRKTVKNAGYLIAGKVVQMAFSFVIGLLTARYLWLNELRRSIYRVFCGNMHAWH